jgi:hypothetical protein
VDRRWPAWDLISYSLDYFFLVEMIFSKLEAKAFYLGNWRIVYWRKSMAIFPSYIKLTFASLLLIHLTWDPTASDFIGLSALPEKFYGIMNLVQKNATELRLDLQGSNLHSMCLLPGGFSIHLPVDPDMKIRWQGPGAKIGLLSP